MRPEFLPPCMKTEGCHTCWGRLSRPCLYLSLPHTYCSLWDTPVTPTKCYRAKYLCCLFQLKAESRVIRLVGRQFFYKFCCLRGAQMCFLALCGNARPHSPSVCTEIVLKAHIPHDCSQGMSSDTIKLCRFFQHSCSHNVTYTYSINPMGVVTAAHHVRMMRSDVVYIIIPFCTD